jgi:hypothetical protein
MCMLWRLRTLGGRVGDIGEPWASPHASYENVSIHDQLGVASCGKTYVDIGHVGATLALVVHRVVLG